jgi:hypothetical protein
VNSGTALTGVGSRWRQKQGTDCPPAPIPSHKGVQGSSIAVARRARSETQQRGSSPVNQTAVARLCFDGAGGDMQRKQKGRQRQGDDLYNRGPGGGRVGATPASGIWPTR